MSVDEAVTIIADNLRKERIITVNQSFFRSLNHTLVATAIPSAQTCSQ